MLKTHKQEEIMNLTELKRELSAASGVDFFNPRYRKIFKKHLVPTEDEETLEEAKAQDAKADASVQEKSATVITDIAKDKLDDAEGKSPDYDATDADERELVKAVNNDQETDKAVQEAEDEDDDAEDEAEAEAEAKEEAAEEAEENAEAEAEGETTETEATSDAESTEEAEVAQANENPADKLVEVTLELELTKAGIRADRMDVARRLFRQDFKAKDSDVAWLKAEIAKYPEWLAKKQGAQAFGMPVGDTTSTLTDVQKHLRPHELAVQLPPN